MSDKTFIVTHPHARAPLTITGKTLEEALEKEGLDPAIWKEQGATLSAPEQNNGEDKGDAGSEDN